ncbi:zinc finger SWIM domain-containing protein 1 [Rhineura floridana]|uniref:zinc finger SWIM domain-containing protein 1 n=1 Tax=Rhineura floridana TaxID=261503 RepID=UPI002AC86FCE|nr:zinc finger SWIM domain-containing protein 1 [Rhineura floridana]XP_061486707.1 zinc finger SWIM domain-containing protein 1 [Rhineura floridana]XP_061486708.1 zinc finger SWIM domain-containing protein 1 [Rhineura floridana]XP_061486709.1 zinc finger SWIM domain-containing protein 1 [Rhineura floridana]
MALDTVKELLSFDCGSLVAYQLDKNSQLESISFQTILMRDVFINHPEVVLIHRTHNPWGKALYVFMVDKPFLKLEGEMTKVIHFSVPTRESAEGLAHMYHTFKAFNPEWKQIKTFLVDPRFRWLPTLSEAFPSADVQLSVFHICKHLQHKIHQVSLEFHTERLILSALRNAMCAPSESNLKKMYTILSDFVKPNLLPQLHKDWLLNEKIWALHRWRTWGECSQYFKDLEMITHSLSQVYCLGPSLDTCITSIAKNYQKGVLKSSLETVPCPATLLSGNISSVQNLLVLNSSAVNSQRPLLPRDPPPTAPQNPLTQKAEVAAEDPACKQEIEITLEEAEQQIKQSLSDICTDPAARLCLNELAVVQSSVYLMGTNEDTVNIQLLEDAQVVRLKGLNNCTCHFSQTFQLPCRHVLAVLNSKGKDVEPERIPVRWRKGHGVSQTGQTSTDGLLEVLRSSWDELLDKYLAVSFLTVEISRLLSQCSHEEFDRRYSTLRELADSWIGPYVQVKL